VPVGKVSKPVKSQEKICHHNNSINQSWQKASPASLLSEPETTKQYSAKLADTGDS